MMTYHSLYTQSAVDLIQRRSSHRSYDGKGLDEQRAQALREAAARVRTGPFGSPVRIELVRLEQIGSRQLRSWGTYGIVKGATCFLVGATRNTDTARADCGYAFEHAVLKATELGLGSCWMGATFHKGVFGRAIQAAPDEIIPVISPVGDIAGRKSAIDLALHGLAGSKTRRPSNELFFHRRYGALLSEEQAGAYAQALAMVRLAPSSMNSQPWRIVKEEQRPVFHFYEHLTGRFGEMLKFIGGGKALMIDMGIAMSHFELAAREAGLHGRWDVCSPRVLYVPARDRYCITWIGDPQS
jgi:nitroreductase